MNEMCHLLVGSLIHNAQHCTSGRFQFRMRHSHIRLQVVATHQYQGEDEDELSFQKGAVIYVVPYEDPEDEVCLF